ncbi:MAG: hypothetical protein NDF52_05515 [archaeon YNP-WB-062]|jgi:predicted nuclease with TOPRIM domain|nr:hypothetical protein [Candidatus Culexarchaeum yellowstonense]
MSVDLKREFLNLLERDIEFRYTVAGYLGLSEVLKKLDSLMEEQNKIWREIKALREEQSKIWEELKSLRENQIKLWENQNKLWEEVRSLREGQNRLWRGQEALWMEVRRIRTTLDRFAISEEEEAWEVVGYRLRELWFDVKLDRLSIEDFEMNIYGVSGDVCVLGEVTVRLGHTLVDELEGRLIF